uniref:Neurotransmitter-gated ion-channel ligand-binding domain-containing protein n=1 Tax=Plectus sambesii TaxID=2011161 RepID=A0A914V910_9BILA
MKILSLLEVNGQQEYVRIALFFYFNWTDEYLTWNPADFNGTESIRAPVLQVWHPDVGIVSMSLKSEDFIEKEERLVIINYNGEVVYPYPFLLTTSCPMQTDDFPFDSQTCTIRITSGSYSSKYVQFTHINDTDLNAAYVRKF